MKLRLWICFCAALLGSVAFGEDPPAGGQSTGLTAERTSLSAVRMGVVNGLVTTLNQTRQVTMDLKFEPLPLTAALVDESSKTDIQPVEFDIPNEAFSKTGDWTLKLKPKQREALLDALYLSPRDFDWSSAKARAAMADAARKSFKAHWYTGTPSRAQIAASIPAKAIIASERDFYYFLFLLRSNGIACSFGTDADVRGANPKIFNKDIVWRVKIYRFPLFSNGQSKLDRFRIAVKAQVRPFPLQFVNANQTEAKLRATFSFLRVKNERGFFDDALLGLDPEWLEIAMESQQNLPGAPTPINSSNDDLRESSLEANLKLLGGLELTDVIAHGLFSGTAETSLASGGILGRGRVTKFVGMHSDLARRGASAFGYTLGVLPDNDNALFGGLSLQLRDLFIAPGFIAQEAGGGNRTAFKPAVALSFDLSRILGMKKDNRYFLDNATISSVKWKDSTDSVAAAKGLLLYSIQRADPAWDPLGTRDRRLRIKLTAAGGTTSIEYGLSADGNTATSHSLPVPVGTGAMEVPLGYDLMKGNFEIDTALDQALNPNDVSTQFLYHSASTPLDFQAGGGAINWNGVLKPSASLLPKDQAVNFATLKAELDADTDNAKALKAKLDPSAVALLSGVMDDKSRIAVIQALNRLLAGPQLDTDGAIKPNPEIASLSPAQMLQNSARVKRNRAIMKQILPSLG